MRVAVLKYPGIRPECYAQLIHAAMALARHPRMQEMAHWPWARFSTWLRSHPFEMDHGTETKECATACSPKQRMRVFPSTMNCWERVLHQLAWFAARGAERATVYDHDTLVGRHIEVLVPPSTYLGAADSLPVRPVANGAKEQAIGGILGGLQGGLSGAGMGLAAGPYGALAGFLVGAGLGAAKGALEAQDPAPAPPPTDARAPPVPPTPPAQPAPAALLAAPMGASAVPLAMQLTRAVSAPPLLRTETRRASKRGKRKPAQKRLRRRRS